MKQLIPKSRIPEGESGPWKVERYTVTEEDVSLHNLRCFINPMRMGGKQLKPGSYTRLMRGGSVVMSDTPSELREHFHIVMRALGHVLVTGLGLGLVANALQRKPEVESVTVIEISPDVIKLVGPSFKRKKKVTIIKADAFTWKPNGQRFDWGWHDIWTNLCVDSLPEMTKLKRHYCRSVTVGQQHCWDEDRLKRLSRRGW